MVFIQWDNSPDIFVHYTSINSEGFKTVAEGQRVKFDIEEGNEGPKAVNVTKINLSLAIRYSVSAQFFDRLLFLNC